MSKKQEVATVEKDIAKITDNPDVTEAQCIEAQKGADMPVSFRLSTWQNRKLIGHFMAKGVAGHILTESVITRDQADRLAAEMVDLVEKTEMECDSPDPSVVSMHKRSAARIKTSAVEAWATIKKVVAERDTVDLQAAQVVAIGTGTKKAESVAPTERAPVMYVTGEQIQVNVAQEQKPL